MNDKIKGSKSTRKGNNRVQNKEKTRTSGAPKEKKIVTRSDIGDKSISSSKLSMPEGRLSNTDRNNDPNWYFLDKSVADQAAAFAINGFNGVPMDITMAHGDDANDAPWPTKVYELDINSILVVYTSPSPGHTAKLQYGINNAALATYAKLSALNAKTTLYAPQDITMLTLAIGEIISLMEHIRRAFGVYFTYSVRNRTMPKYLIQAMGIDFDDMAESFADYRLKFNSLVTALNKIPFPANIAYLYKCADMYQHVYTDGDSDMAQLIVTRPYSTWTLVDTYNDQGSGLSTTILPRFGETGDCTLSEWFRIIENMINALLTSSTYNYIYSDVLTLSTKENAPLLYMDYLIEGYIVYPEYNTNFLLQLHNATMVGSPSAPSAALNYTKLNDVECDVNKNIIKYEPIFPQQQMVPMNVIVDFLNGNPSVEDRIEATRYTVAVADDVYEITIDSNKYIKFESLPDHFINYIAIIDPNYEEEVGFLKNISVQYWESTDITGAVMALVSGVLVTDWAPIIYIKDSTKNSMVPLSDINYYTTVDSVWIYRVNDIIFQALFTLR